MCVFNFFFWKSWLAGEGGHLLQKKKLKTEFCGCSDTRRAFSRACIAKSAYHKPSLSRRMGAALPLRPCGSATRRRPSRRGPQRHWGHRAGAPPPVERASGGKSQSRKKKGDLITEYSETEQEAPFFRHANHAKKMSACGHQPSCSSRLGESSRLAVFLLFYKEKGFYARPLVTPAGVISAENPC